MKNLIEYEEEIKSWPREAIEQELKSPTGAAPSFLLFSEMQRRDRDRARFNGISNEPSQRSMLQEALESSAPGLKGNPQAGIGMQQLPPQQHQGLPQKPYMGFEFGGEVSSMPDYRDINGRKLTREEIIAAGLDPGPMPRSYGSVDSKNWTPNAPIEMPNDPPQKEGFFGRMGNLLTGYAPGFWEHQLREIPKQTDTPISVSPESETSLPLPALDYSRKNFGQPALDYRVQHRAEPPQQDKIGGIGSGATWVDDALQFQSDPTMDRIQALIDAQTKDKRNVVGEMLLRAGATIAGSNRPFGAAVGDAMGAATDQMAQARDFNAASLQSALRGQVGLGELAGRKQEAQMDLQSRRELYAMQRDVANQESQTSMAVASSKAAMEVAKLAQQKQLSEANADISMREKAYKIAYDSMGGKDAFTEDNEQQQLQLRARATQKYNEIRSMYDEIMQSGGAVRPNPKGQVQDRGSLVSFGQNRKKPSNIPWDFVQEGYSQEELNDIDEYIDSVAYQYDVDPNMIRAIIQTESSGNPNAMNPGKNRLSSGQQEGAWGLAQFTQAAMDEYGVNNPFDPYESVHGIARILEDAKKHGAELDEMPLFYHAGQGDFRKMKKGKREKSPADVFHQNSVLSNYRRLSRDKE